MGFRQRSAGLILCSLLSGSVALSLDDLGLASPPPSETSACRKLFSSSITSCNLGDFENGCSKSCKAGVTKTFDGLTLECSPRYVSTLLGSNLSSAGVQLLCEKSSSHPEKEPAASKTSTSSGQETSSKSSKEAPSPTTELTSTDQPVETISPITSSSTTRNPGNLGSPVISKGPPPDIATLQPAATTSSESSSSKPPTSTSSEPEITSPSTPLNSSSATQNSTPKPARGSITSTSSSAASSTRSSVTASTQSANSTTALPAGAIGNEELKKHKKSSTGPIVGGILGGVTLIVLLITLAFYFIIRPQRRRQQEEDEDYNQKTATITNSPTLTSDTIPPKDPIYSAANPYPTQPPAMPTLVTKMPYRSNSQRSGVSELVRNDSRLSMRTVNRSNSMSDRYDISPIDRYGNPMWDPYGPPDRYAPYNTPPMDDRYGLYSTAPTKSHRYDPTGGVAPISFMEAEWNQLRGQQPLPMRQNSYSKSRPNFINYPSVIEEERESVSAASGPGSVYELGNDGNGSKTSVRRSEDNKGVSMRRSEDKIRTGTPDVPRRSPLRVVNGTPDH